MFNFFKSKNPTDSNNQDSLELYRKHAAESIEDCLHTVESSHRGLSSKEVGDRLSRNGPNSLRRTEFSGFTILWRQLSGNPLSSILIISAGVAFATGDHNTALYVLGMVVLSIVLGFWNEFSAERTVLALLHKISLEAIVLRNGEKQDVPVSNLTIGDIVFLAPGSVVPADLRLIETQDLEINESSLSGESVAINKVVDPLNLTNEINIGDLKNIVFMGTTVTSGQGKGVVIVVGRQTQFGMIAEDVRFTRPRTQFQKGLASFGFLLIKVIIILTIAIFVINVLLGRDLLTTLLFALAIAIGLTPELLPVVVTVGLARGAAKLAKRHVITKQLIAIENLGNMDVLCTDKTGTLTEGVLKVISHIDTHGKDKEELLHLGLICNSAVLHHKIIGNTIDTAIWQHAKNSGITVDENIKKIFEEQFDYEKRLMFTVIKKGTDIILIAKGAPDEIIERVSKDEQTRHLKEQAILLYKQGLHTIALATKKVSAKDKYGWDDISNMHFEGFITFADTPKLSAANAIEKLCKLNVSVKIITGDNEIITERICKEVGIKIEGLVIGSEITKADDIQLQSLVSKANVFARITPNQKMRIIQALRNQGYTVGFLGDGINDTPSLHSADVGISVNSAVDVAKDAAQVILLQKSLDVIADGVTEGRQTFMNTIKYILMGTGSNFGEMVSAAAASFVLPFLPMTSVQVLLENSLYDLSQIPIASDKVDEELLRKPKHWDIKLIYRFMLAFGLLSAVWSLLTYAAMLWVFHASVTVFQSAVFIEALTTEMVIVLVARTMRVPFFTSLPSKWLVAACLSVTAVGLLLPFSFIGPSLELGKLPLNFYLFLLVMLILYGVVVEITKLKFRSKFQL